MNIVCVGEVLWDSLPNGLFLGGAPTNVAANLQKLGFNAQILSAVGNDVLGTKTINALNEVGFDVGTIQKNERPTGLVDVKLNERGVPTYIIHEKAAWDYIAATESALTLVESADYVIIGSLVFRHAENAVELFKLLDAAKGKVVVDVNFRSPYYSETMIDQLLTYADILKVNDDEIEEIAGWKGLSTNYELAIPALCEQFQINQVFVTLGQDGAALYKNGKFTAQPRFHVTVKDTVGAGDAFLAGAISATIQQKTDVEVLAFANAMGAFVASRNGATPALDLAEIERLLES